MVIILLDQQCAEFNEMFKKTVNSLNDYVPHGHHSRYLIGTCNIGNAMNSKNDLGTNENGNGKMARTIDPLFVQIL